MGFWTCLWTFSKCFEVQSWKPGNCQLMDVGDPLEDMTASHRLSIHQDPVSGRLPVTLAHLANFGDQFWFTKPPGTVFYIELFVWPSARWFPECLLTCYLLFPIVTTESEPLAQSLRDLGCSIKSDLLVNRNLSDIPSNQQIKIYRGLPNCSKTECSGKHY